MNTVHNKIMKLSVLTQLQQLLMMLMMMAAVVSCQNVFDPAVPDDHYFRYALHCMDQLQAQSGHEMREDFGRQMNGIVQQIQFELKQAVYSTNASISSIVSRLDAVESMCRTVNEKITRFESLIEPKATEESQQTTGAQSFECSINVRAYSGYEAPPCRHPQEGFVDLNGRRAWQAGWCSSFSNPRGVNTMIVDPVSCTASNHRCFDTHIGAAPTQDLVNYINYVRTGALLVGVTGDEPMLNIGSALSLLRVAGVEVADVQNRGSFAFVIQIGYPEKTVFAKSQPTGQYSSLNVIVRGSTTDNIQIVSR